MKIICGLVLTVLLVSVYASEEENILETLFENSKFTPIAKRIDDFEDDVYAVAGKFQQYATKKDQANLQRLQTSDLKNNIVTLAKIKSDFNAIGVNAGSVWEQVQSRIINTQIHEIENMFQSINIMIQGVAAGVPIPEFHFSSSLAVARSFLEHNLVTVTIDAAKTEKLIKDASKKTELGNILREMVQVASNAKHEMSALFSDAIRFTRSFDKPTHLSVSQRMHSLTTIKIYGEIAAVAQEKLNQL